MVSELLFYIIITAIFMFWLGYKIAYVQDNNYSELFLSYIRRISELEREKYYYMDCYNQLLCSLDDDLIDDTIVDCNGRTIGVILKKDAND